MERSLAKPTVLRKFACLSVILSLSSLLANAMPLGQFEKVERFSGNRSNLSNGAIAGILVGAVVTAVLVLCVCCTFCRCCRCC